MVPAGGVRLLLFRAKQPDTRGNDCGLEPGDEGLELSLAFSPLWSGKPEAGAAVRPDAVRYQPSASNQDVIEGSAGGWDRLVDGYVDLREATPNGSARGSYRLETRSGRTLEGDFEASWCGPDVRDAPHYPPQ